MQTRAVKKFSPGKAVTFTVMTILAIFMLIPFIWMLSASLKTSNEVFQTPIQWIPANPRWSNYIDIWKQIDFMTYYANTIKLTVIITIISMLTSSAAAYAFAKVRFPERNAIFMAYVATIAVPFQAIMIPQFIIMKNLGLTNTHWALIFLQAFTTYGVFLLRQFYMGIPEGLSESARIDGLSEFGIYSRIILPLSKPALASLCIFQFVFVWNDFLGPLIYLTSDSKKTIQLGIRKFITEYSASYELIMAASVCSLIPVLIIFFGAQRFFIEGIATTGIKG